MAKKLIPLVCAFAMTMAVGAQPELKGTAEQLSQYLQNVPRTVRLTGEAEVKVPADRVLISIKVVTENKSLQEASRVNQELRAKMLRALADKGVPAERIHASKFSSTPRYGMFGEKAKSYRVENVVKITAQDEKDFQTVAGLVDTTPELRYDSIEFEHSDKEGLKKQAITRALDKVTEKGRLYEGKLGVKLTPKGFTEGEVVPVSPQEGRKMYGLANSYSKAAPAFSSAAGEVAGGVGEETPTSFDELVYRAVVSVEYAVESK